VLPGTKEKYPGGTDWQVEAPAIGEKYPGKHGAQLVDPLLAEIEPGLQIEHILLPADGEK